MGQEGDCRQSHIHKCGICGNNGRRFHIKNMPAWQDTNTSNEEMILIDDDFSRIINIVVINLPTVLNGKELT